MHGCDVVVVGGGPAGAAAAVVLARAGRDVVVVDRASFPRDKTCGDGLTTLALRRLEHLGLPLEAVEDFQLLTGATIRSPAGREAVLPFPAGGVFAGVVPRRSLDAALLDLARGAGAKVLDGHAFTGAVRSGGGDSGDGWIELVVEGVGPVRARYAVGADGMWSPLRRAVGAGEPGYLGGAHALRQYHTGVSGVAASQLLVWFDADLLPGYAWSFPLPGGRANVGLGIHRTPGRRVQDLKALWPEVLARPHVRAALGPGAHPEEPPRTWPIPTRLGPLTAGRVLFVGDAAAVVDPFSGEGIGQALRTGELAAEAILAAGALAPAAARRRYRAAVHHELATDHWLSQALLATLATPCRAELALRAGGLTPWTRRTIARWLWEDEPRAVALTPARWHPHLLRRPAPYQALG